MAGEAWGFTAGAAIWPSDWGTLGRIWAQPPETSRLMAASAAAAHLRSGHRSNMSIIFPLDSGLFR